MARLILVAALGAAGIAAACGGGGTAGREPGAGASRVAASASPSGAPREVASNVRFEDYAGTRACEPCHASYVRSWLASPMHNMTRASASAEVRGPFDGTVFTFKGDTAKLETVGGARFVSITSTKHGSGIYRVTKIVGGHHREDYVGVPVAAARPDARALGAPDEELVLPVSFVYASRQLRYKGYSVMVKERSGLRAGPVWNQTCIFCHNTPPYLSTVLGALAGSAATPYQGQVVDPLLPDAKRARYVVTDEGGLRDALGNELARLGGKGREPTPAQALVTTRSHFREKHLVEVGIGCEACHLGAAEHVRDPSAKPSFEPRSGFLAVRYPDGTDRATERVNRACARCHQVLFSGYEHTWEGGARRRAPGGSNINSGEARDMLLGACASKLTCAGCHEPHAEDATAQLRALDAAGKDALCTRCHQRYAAPDALRAHAHHDPAREGARCVSCHMPEKTMSLDGGLSRYHRIGSPTDPERVLLDRPLECALCHADKSVGALLSTMESWWKKTYDRPALLKLYGDLKANALLATAERGKPHEQGVAFFVLGRERMKAATPVLAANLTHAYPLVRGYAKRALDAVAGAPVPVDIDAEDNAIEEATRAWLGARPPPTAN